MGFYFASNIIHLKNQGRHDEVIRQVSGGIVGLLARGFVRVVATMSARV